MSIHSHVSTTTNAHIPILLKTVLSSYIPSFIGNDYFCETGVPPGQIQSFSGGHRTFHANDPLWDGGGCDPTSTCCTFNNPPWFCKQLPPRSTNDDLEYDCVQLMKHLLKTLQQN